MKYHSHPELTRVRSIWFLLFEIKRVLVYNLTILKPIDLFILYFFIQNVYADKKVFNTMYLKYSGLYTLIVQGSWCIYLDAINILTWYCFYSLDAGKGSQHDMFGFPRHTVMINKSFIFLLFRLFLIFSNKHSFLLKCKMINASHIFLDFYISNL